MGKRYLINIAGGGIRFYGILMGFIKLTSLGVKPNVLSGVSAGAIVSFIYYALKLKEGELIAENTDDPRIIFSKKGDPRGRVKGVSVWAIYRLLRKRNHLGVMDNLESNLRKLVTKDHWNDLQKSNDLIDCYIHCIDIRTKKKYSFNLRYLSYDQAIAVVIGSASIVPFVPPRKVNIQGEELYLVDGGFRDSSAGSYLIDSGTVSIDSFDECVTIWSRSDIEDYTDTSAENIGNISDIGLAAISMMMREIAINDEKLEKKLCEKYDKKYSPIHLDIKTSGVYDITKEEIKEAKIQAEKVVSEYFNSL